MFKKYPNHSMGRLLTAFRELVESWWRVDRIRASPREGRLLRIAPDSLLCVHGVTFHVVRRAVRETARGPLVCYEMRSDTGPGQLWVAAESPELVFLVRGGSEEKLVTDEIEVWG